MSDFNEVLLRLSEIERRLTILEKPTAPKYTPPPATLKVTTPKHTTCTAPTPSELIPRPESVGTASSAPSGSNLLAVIALICFILAGGFVIKLSIDSGWLTPARQIGLAILLGLACISTGFSIFKFDRSYSSYLPAAGIVILYLSAFAAYRFHHLISFTQGIVAISAVSSLCFLIHLQLEESIYLIMAAIGSYLAPSILGIDDGSSFGTNYYIFCSVVFAMSSILVKSRVPTLVGAYLAIAITVTSGAPHETLMYLLPLHFAIYSLGTFLYTRLNKISLSENEAWAFFPVLLFFYAAEYNSLSHVVPTIAPWISLGFAALVMGLYQIAKGKIALQSGQMILAFSSIVIFHSVYLNLLPDAARPWLFSGILLLACFVPASKARLETIPKLAIFAVLIIEYIRIMDGLFEKKTDEFALVSVVSVVSLLVLFILRRSRITERSENVAYLYLLGAHSMAINSLYHITSDIGSLAVSGAWLFYAIVIMTFGFIKRDQIMAKSALFVLMLAAAKVLVYDASSADAIIRILCLLLTGAVLYGCGILLRRISTWQPG